MSNKASAGETPFTFSEPQQNLRLVELPQELLELLSASNPPRLYFKSSAARSSGDQSMLSSPVGKAAEYLHLCTPTQSYQVRQVSTSNSVYVIKPSVARPATRDGSHDAELENALEQPTKAMTAIAKVDTMLELIPVSHDVLAMLDQLLPVCDASENLSAEDADRYFFLHSIAASKSALFSDIPAPDSQCNRAWRDVLAFESKGRCARPGPSTMLGVWQAIISETTLERFDLTGELDIRRLFQTEQISGINVLVAQAILLYLDGKEVSAGTAYSVQIDQLKTVRWTGSLLLHALSEKPIPKAVLLKDEYINQWQDLLPENWRKDATLEKLPEGSFTVGNVDCEDAITWNGSANSSLGSVPVPTAQAARVTSGKRKWHEKFKAQRKESKN